MSKLFEYLTEDEDPSQGRAIVQVKGEKASEVISEFDLRREQIFSSAYSNQVWTDKAWIRFGMALGESFTTETFFSETRGKWVTPLWNVIMSYKHDLFDRIAYQISAEGQFHYVELPTRLRNIDDALDGYTHVDRPTALKVIEVFKKERDDIEQRRLSSSDSQAPGKYTLMGGSELGLGIWFVNFDPSKNDYSRLYGRGASVCPVIDLEDYRVELES